MGRVLKRDPGKCINCRSCEVMLTGFISEHNGTIVLSAEQYDKEETRIAVDDIISCCIGNAIELGIIS